MGYPSAWRHRSMLVEAGVDAETLAYASIFAARYRFAVAFEGIRADRIGKDTVRGYETLMRLLLIQTALEALSKVAGPQVCLDSDPLAARLRADPELVEILLDPGHRHAKYGRKKNQDAAIQKLDTDKHRDLYPVMRRIRNMFAHGDSTSNRFALDRRRSRREWLTDLGDLGLTCADDAFTVWVDAQLQCEPR